MKLSDVVGHANLSAYAEVALVLFFAVFLAVVWRLFLSGRRAELEAAAQLPLDDEAAVAVRRSTPEGGAA